MGIRPRAWGRFDWSGGDGAALNPALARSDRGAPRALELHLMRRDRKSAIIFRMKQV
jgi:hypothetical protein